MNEKKQSAAVEHLKKIQSEILAHARTTTIAGGRPPALANEDAVSKAGLVEKLSETLHSLDQIISTIDAGLPVQLPESERRRLRNARNQLSAALLFTADAIRKAKNETH